MSKITNIKSITEDDFKRYPKDDKYRAVIIEKLIRRKYSLSDELAIQRQRDTKPEEFKEYFDYVETCKIEAKQILNQ